MGESKKKGAKLTEQGQIVLSYWFNCFFCAIICTYCASVKKRVSAPIVQACWELELSLGALLLSDMSLFTQGLRETCRV